MREDFGKQLPERAHDYLAEIRTGAERMRALIDGLLEMSRSARGTLVEEPVDLAEITRELLRQFRHDQPGRDVRVQLAGDLVVEGDSRLLRNLMQILLENAWKYTSLGASAQIAIRRVQAAGLDCVCIPDNGAGFSPEFAHKLFEPSRLRIARDGSPTVSAFRKTSARASRNSSGCANPRPYSRMPRKA